MNIGKPVVRGAWLVCWCVLLSILLVLYTKDRTGHWPGQVARYLPTETEIVASPTSTVVSELSPVELPVEPTQKSEAVPTQTLPQEPKTLVVTMSPFTFPNISDTDVLLELNAYRAAHTIPQLVENSNLCRYAEKRVRDLVAFGGLDNHAGFIADTASAESLPDALRAYSGGSIGENLAYQNCKNMTTGDGFLASTPQQLIEWCFDSSTKGHREAQLNPKFTAACVRHDQGYFVVIFGE